jgi:ABC-type transporter MlaC component
MFLLIAYIVHTKNTRKQRPIIIRHTASKLWQSLSPKDAEILFEFIEYYTISTHDDSIFRYMSQTTKYENSNVYQNYQIITSFQVSDNYILFEFRYLNFMLAGMAGLHKTTLTYHEIMNITL